MGSKNVLLNGRLLLNASLYYIDWSDMQGSEPPQDLMGNVINSAAVIGNIGDASSKGLEIETSYFVTDNFSVDFGIALNEANFDGDTQYDAAARYYYYQCDRPVIMEGERCGNSDVGGNQLPRNSETQVVAGINYKRTLSDDWSIDMRLGANYQSEQFITPLNQAYIPARTLFNADAHLEFGEHWNLGIWAKNLTDREYIGGILIVSEQNKLIVSQGLGRSMGATLSYQF